MLTEFFQYLRNWFCRESDRFVGDYTIASNTLPFSLVDGEPYIRIVGSRYNDGVYKVKNAAVTGLTNESFNGAIWVMSVPPDVAALAKEIDDWVKANADSIASPYQSESFGGYSYSKGYAGGEAQGITWQSQFAARLSPWRKI